MTKSSRRFPTRRARSARTSTESSATPSAFVCSFPSAGALHRNGSRRDRTRGRRMTPAASTVTHTRWPGSATPARTCAAASNTCASRATGRRPPIPGLAGRRSLSRCDTSFDVGQTLLSVRHRQECLCHIRIAAMRKLAWILLCVSTSAAAQDTFTSNVDKAVNEILAKTGAPSASVAVVKDDKIIYTHAYGNARIDPPMPATPEMRYSIGSISKQFTAAAILMLAEEGKLSLDDKMVRWLPDLTRANDVTLRELLSMTSGYQDFWPQDYVMPRMLEPVTAQEILNDWARKPLDFEPGTKWQYSNTNYVIAGVIVEKVAGMPLLDLLQRRVFGPLQMSSVFNTDLSGLGANDPTRYLSYAFGPRHQAP